MKKKLRNSAIKGFAALMLTGGIVFGINQKAKAQIDVCTFFCSFDFNYACTVVYYQGGGDNTTCMYYKPKGGPGTFTPAP